MHDVALLKEECRGRWRDALPALTGISPEVLNGKSHPCPQCGGVDRFSAFPDFAETGGVICRHCHPKSNGDGLAALMWANGVDFKTAVNALAGYLGYNGCDVDSGIVAEMAWRKNTGLDALRKFGAIEALRESDRVCRVPMYDADMQVVGNFDLAPGALEKGKMTHESKHGLFAAGKPNEGDTVAIVEGVKDASALDLIGVQAVGLPTSFMAPAFARFFRGCHVIIVPDRDRAGIKGADDTAKNLYGVAASIKIAELPAAFKQTGGDDVRDVLRTRDGEQKVTDAIRHARTWMPTREGEQPIKFLSLPQVVSEMLDEPDQSELLLQTNLPGVDDSIGGGVLPGEMLIIAGRPSHGKTVAGMQVLDKISERTAVLLLSEEMSARALARRVVCGVTDVAEKDWRSSLSIIKGRLTVHFAGRKPFLIVESTGTADRAVEAIALAKKDYDIGAVMVDYVSMLRGKGATRYEQVSDTSTRLKQAAIEHNIALIAICQLNRGIEYRQPGKGPPQSTSPKMSDLRDSGQLEQDADLILFVEWLHRTNPDKYEANDYRIRIMKNRNRGIKKSNISCHFRPERQRLYEIERRDGMQATPVGNEPLDNYEPAFAAFDGNSGDDF